MSFLYKKKEEQTIEVQIGVSADKEISLDFYSDCGKFGTYESLAGYKLTAKRLLQILHDRDDYDDSEL
jgi:hypothetical protein